MIEEESDIYEMIYRIEERIGVIGGTDEGTITGELGIIRSLMGPVPCVEIDIPIVGDTFTVKTYVAKEGLLKAIFFQDIYRKNDNKLMFQGKITAVVIKNGKPIEPDILLKPIL